MKGLRAWTRWSSLTIPQRILVHVAGGAGLVIAVATGVTYGIVFQGSKHRDLQHLQTYVIERARREEMGFRQVEQNLRLVGGQFLKRMENAIPGNYQEKWNQRFQKYPDGAWRSREEFRDGRKYSTLWAHRDVQLTPELQTQVLRAQDICDELLPGWCESFPSIYFVFPGWLNIGFDPRIPNWVWDTPSDYDPRGLEWYQLALPAGNPGKGLSWTGVIEEPTARMPIVSVYLPLERNGRFVGSIGHDLLVGRLMEETTQSGLPGAVHVIFRHDGRLVAHPTKGQDILAAGGRLRMQDCGEPAMASLYRAAVAGTGRAFSGFDAGSRSYFSVARLSGPEWYFLTMMPVEEIRAKAFESAQGVLWSGVVSLAVVLGFLASILRRQIADPLSELMRATRQMTAGDPAVRAAVGRVDEMGALASAFNEMAAKVASRDAALRQLNQDLERRVAERTSELRQANRALDEARHEALRLLSRERELHELKSEFVSVVSHEFRTPLEIILSSVDNLERYHDRLVPETRQELLRSVHKAVRRMAGMMEEVLVLGRLETGRVPFAPVAFGFRAFCQRVCDEIRVATSGRCPIRLEMDGIPEEGVGDESLLRHIFTNLLSNAVKYSAPGQFVDFVVRREGEGVVCRIVDRGCGIPEADRRHVFQAFHRSRNVRHVPGTGLGLLIVRRCVELHGGEIHFESVEGRGTTFTVTLPMGTQDL